MDQNTVSTSGVPKLKLCADNLAALSKRVQVPTYDPKTLISRIVHIGVGGFNRAHQATYLEDLLRRADRAMYQAKQRGRACHVLLKGESHT